MLFAQPFAFGAGNGARDPVDTLGVFDGLVAALAGTPWLSMACSLQPLPDDALASSAGCLTGSVADGRTTARWTAR